MIGQIVGNYKIEEKLGEGGMGAVYKGVDTMLDREVAIKALRPELASQTSVVERFRSEAVTLAKLNHPNIATLYTMFRQGEELYMVLEFVRGETLDGIMQRRGAMPAEEAIPVFCQVLDGIDHAHELGIVHRDIKPANMMLTEKGTLKVLDFGIARLLGSARMTRAGNIIGTLEYMAPEQVKGAETDGRSDIYALGMMLYEVLTGQLPFQTENEFELMKLQTEVMPAPPREVNPNIPEEVEEAIMKAIQKNPDDRFQTAGEMRDLLLEAGFGTQGTMHGVTGTFKARAGTRPSRPAVSKIDRVSSEIAEPAKSEVKSTRLGEAAAAPKQEKKEKSVKATRLGAAAASASTSAKSVKSTRLGDASAFASQPTGEAKEPPKSFLSNLSAVHYIGAGVGALVLIGLLVLVPVLLLGGSKTAETKPVEKPKEEIQQKPEVVTMPQQAPQTMQPPATDNNPTLSSQPASDTKPLVPVEGVTQPTDKASAPKQDKTVAIAQKPIAPKPDKPAATKPKSTKKSAEELLTGN